jgi:hypothetical protein
MVRKIVGKVDLTKPKKTTKKAVAGESPKVEEKAVIAESEASWDLYREGRRRTCGR